MRYLIEEINIKNFRSIGSLKIKIRENNLVVICGSNNVGKTNVLRALNLFFSDKDLFNAENDIPYHISAGSRGGGYKITITLSIRDRTTSYLYTITKTYTEENNINVLKKSGLKDDSPIEEDEIDEFLENFRYIFIESSNVDIPALIRTIVNDEVLSLGMKRRARNQKESLKKLEDFISQSKVTISKIETDITEILLGYLKTVSGLNTENWRVKINFPEYEYLRDAISGMINFTLFDSNHHELESKGAGIQRIMLLSIIKYINEKTKQQLVWAIDEPEIFLQPSLQKGLFNELKETSQTCQIFITTHSQFFIDIENLTDTHLLIGTLEKKSFVRKKGHVYYKVNTNLYEGKSYEKVQEIKSHLGITRSDSWEIMPNNLIVEGHEDLRYITKMSEKLGIPLPNIIVAGGATKFTGLLSYLDYYCSESKFNSKVICLLDTDTEGRTEFDSITSKMKSNKYKKLTVLPIQVSRCDGEIRKNIEIEDLIYPPLILESINLILQNRRYNVISKDLFESRTDLAYDNTPILKFLTQITAYENKGKHSIDFESDKMKYELCETVCNLISQKNTLKDLDKEFPKVKAFLNQLSL